MLGWGWWRGGWGGCESSLSFQYVPLVCVCVALTLVGDSHFKEWMGVEGIRVVLGTDDVGVFGSPLSNEYRIVAEAFGLGRGEVCALARGVVDVIFGGEGEKERLRGLMWEE